MKIPKNTMSNNRDKTRQKIIFFLVKHLLQSNKQKSNKAITIHAPKKNMRKVAVIVALKIGLILSLFLT